MTATTSLTKQVGACQRQSLLPEIVLNIGEYLDKPSLYACLQVSQDWYALLYPFIWIDITKAQVCCPSFPLQLPVHRPTLFWFRLTMEKPRKTQDLERLGTYLQLTRSFEWYDDPVTQSAMRNDTSPIPTPPALEALRMMPNLVRLSLAIAKDCHASEILWPILQPQNLPHLRFLILDLSSMVLIPNIYQLFPLFSRLEELALPGPCYHAPNLNEQAAGVPPPPFNGLEEKPWKLKKLTAEWMLPFMDKCAALEHLSLKQWGFYVLIMAGHFDLDILVLHLKLVSLKAITIFRTTPKAQDEFRILEGEPLGRHSLWKRSNPAVLVNEQEAPWTLERIFSFTE
ncbi:MAG: hypothetical protein J3R72DRAFT_426800 [Linnemannia gamsii]|nr:MAG: hypothetical protein J3R72DRAFT_426800 [Linnemannia gamsii]